MNKKCLICGKKLTQKQRKHCGKVCGDRSYYLNNKKKIIKRVLEWKSKNKPRVKKRMEEYRAKNRKKLNAYAKKYYSKHRRRMQLMMMRRQRELRKKNGRT